MKYDFFLDKAVNLSLGGKHYIKYDEALSIHPRSCGISRIVH